jgi:hypothetical protein
MSKTIPVRIILTILAAVGGHDSAAEAEKDCDGDYAERLHLRNLRVARAARDRVAMAVDDVGLYGGRVRISRYGLSPTSQR